MLSNIWMADAAVPAAPALADTALANIALVGPLAFAVTSARVRPGVGASLRCYGPAWLSDGALLAGHGILLAGRQARGEIALFSNGTHAAGLAEFARHQRTSKKYSHSTKMYARPTTRIATTGGGAWGPHPARDPV